MTGELPRRLESLDAAAIVVGTVIGSGIFLTPHAVARSLPSASLILIVWLFTGLLSFFGALAFAELGTMMPATGGQYVYLREAYGPLWAFLCGWTLFLVVQSGGIATLAVGFAIYLSHFVPLSPAMSRVAAVGLVAILTWVNYRGVGAGAATQKLFTALKISGLALIIGGALFSGSESSWDASSWALSGFSLTHFGEAMIATLWTYEGWNVISFIAGEVKRPQRNLPLSLGAGVGVVIAIYLLANVAYLKALPIGEIAATERVAAAVAERTLGSLGAATVTLTILLSIIGSINGSIMTVPRIYFAQARDGLLFAPFGRVHPRFQTPSFSILAQGIWVAVLTVSGSYEKLFSYSMFAAWIFYGMAALAVLILRRKQPDRPRPYRMWGYPVTPLGFAAVSFWFVGNTIWTQPGPSLAGLLLIAAGVPLYYWRRRSVGR